ncbi:OLC1v1023636C1 [Oldenlandia corymbosa var. corymbosa]|uniref:OLC1v1023636C1 n=1 Tax=Oldenlandia corymbosa var. corymbosa TaxID=529605 RepID=A0AAV1C2V7_OLDCO|nr:OLC1v1023636C1 [Oldenlandia corymbosa var. corymbosa]
MNGEAGKTQNCNILKADDQPAAIPLLKMTITAVFAFCVIPVLVLIWKMVNWVWIKPKNFEKHLKEQGFNGNPYRLLIGDLKEITALKNEAYSKPIDFSDDIIPRIIPEAFHLSKKYGKNSYVWFGPQPGVHIQDSNMVREASQDVNLFHKPNVSEFSRLITPGLGSYNGDKWAKHRKLINPAFRMEKLKNMLPSFHASAKEMLQKWEEIVSPQGWSELDVWPSLSNLSSDAISRTAFGSNYEEGRRIFELQEEQVEHCFKAIWSSFIPGWRFLPTTRNRRMRQIEKDVNDSIRHIINLRLNAVKAGKSFDDDLLGILLDSNSQEINRHSNKDFGMTIQEVIQECKLFYFAGQETTSVLLVWTMILLSRYEDWQTRAREEVLQLFGTNQPDFDGVNRLKVVNMILHEVLRLYPPLPVNARISTADAKLGDKHIPGGTLVLFETLLMHYDPEVWGEDVKEFKPDRFSEGVSNATKGQLAFFPFGAGPRICIGQNFSMLEAKLVLAMILQRFSFELSPSYAHAPRSIFTLKPQYGAHLILRKL